MDREQTIQQIVESITRLQRPRDHHSWLEAGLTRAQAGVLFVIFFHKDVTAKDISSFLGVTGSSVTQIIEPLAGKGLIVRHEDKQDRRVVRISLTAAGRGTVKRLVKSKASHIRAGLEKLNDKELIMLAKLHSKMAE